MKEQSLTFDDLAISRSDIYAAMGYGGAIPDDEVAVLVDLVIEEARSIAVPRFMYGVVDASRESRGITNIAGESFRTGAIIGSYLDGMEKACIFVTTAGVEYDAYIQSIKNSGDILKEFVADSVGSVIAEGCVDQVCKCLEQEFSIPHSLPYSPGYCAWDISEQKKLFPLFPDRPCGITLTPTCLMHPVKSVSGFVAMGETLVRQPYRCEICTNKNCYKRRTR